MFIRILLLAVFVATSADAQQRRVRPAQPMTLTTSAWQDGGMIPPKHAQPGGDVSPPLAWSRVPDGTESFVLIVRDLDALTVDGSDNYLHWMLWNIPKDTRALAEGVPEVEELPDGTRQISTSGPWYRGPAAPAPGPVHHYAFELYALSGKIDVPAASLYPAPAEAAVRAAMSGKILGKATLIGLFKRG